MLLNCGVGEDSWGCLGSARRSNQSILKEISPEHSLEGWCWSWNSSTLATWCEELTRLKRPWCWERLKVGGEGDNRGWDGSMASLTQWTWVWASSRCWWWTGRPGGLQSMGSQRVRHDWATELTDRITACWRLLPGIKLKPWVIKAMCFRNNIIIANLVLLYSLRLLIFLQESLIPACDSSCPAFHMMHSA